MEQAVNQLPLLSEDSKRQVEIKLYTGEQVQYINKMEQDEKFQNKMENMLNKLQGHSNEDEAMRLRMQILNKLSSKEQQRVKRGFGPQMRLTSFYESQILRKITQQNKKRNSHIHRMQQETQVQKTLEELEKAEKHSSLNLMVIQQLGVGQSPWTIVWLDELSRTARENPRPVKHKTEIETTHQQKAKDSFSNKKQLHRV
ncbi:MAG: hypothetical protein EZS28_001974 [Streblomastix strix]|uniref:Uncharacterized protein n=1 Tax=Streblomastix strix TaxID=222440 RepID=A0A5J4X647_9EUKA|nr:MAG: hypothetical protein EZS28_001974 [Streblomastix strix]